MSGSVNRGLAWHESSPGFESPALHKSDTGVLRRGSDIEGHSWLLRMLETSPGYMKAGHRQSNKRMKGQTESPQAAHPRTGAWTFPHNFASLQSGKPFQLSSTSSANTLDLVSLTSMPIKLASASAPQETPQGRTDNPHWV